MSDGVESKVLPKCGFCRRGSEVQDVCGKLWHDESKKCTAHQRCMQYSAGLVQYTMKRFGGFKVPKVLKEQARGKRLKCAICGKSRKTQSPSTNPSTNGATSGCALAQCHKTFHFYCARTSSDAVAHKMKELKDGKDIDYYLVFCSKEHQQRYESKQKSRLQPVPDSEDESGGNDGDESDSSDESVDNTSALSVGSGKQLPPGKIRSSESLDSADRSSDDDQVADNKLTQTKAKSEPAHDSSEPGSGKKTAGRTVGTKVKSSFNDDGIDPKRMKLSEESAADSQSSEDAYVICFVEHMERVTVPVTQALQKAAYENFGVSSEKVFVWQYNGESLSGEHFVYLLNEIGKALVHREDETVRNLVFNMSDTDVNKFSTTIKANTALDAKSRDALYKRLREQIASNFAKANELYKSTKCLYNFISSGLDANVAFILVAPDVIDNEVGLIDNEPGSVHGRSAEIDGKCAPDLDKKSQSGTEHVGKDGQKTTNGACATDAHITASERDVVVQKADVSSKGKSEKATIAKDSMPTGKLDGSKSKATPKSHGTASAEVRGVMDGADAVVQKADVSSKGKSEKATIAKDSAHTDKPDGAKSKVTSPKGHGTASAKVRDKMDGAVTNGEKDVGSGADVEPDDDDDVPEVECPKSGNMEDTGVAEIKNNATVSDLYLWESLPNESARNCPSNDKTGKDTEFLQLSHHLKNIIKGSTSFQRFPVPADFPILSPSEHPELSVTWRLAEAFKDKFEVVEKPNVSSLLMASMVIFIGPYDEKVVHHCEIVRRRIMSILDNMTPADGDIYCVTDVGGSVGLTCLEDIVDIKKFPDVQVHAYAGVDPANVSASCVLMHFVSSVP